MAYKHGVYNTEQATSLTVPIQGSAGLPGHFRHGAHSPGERPRGGGPTPQADYSYKEAVEARRLFGRFRELHPLPEH